MMLSRIRHILKNNGYDMKPRDALHIASSYMLIDAGEEMITTDPDRSASRIRSLFWTENKPKITKPYKNKRNKFLPKGKIIK